MLIDDLNNFKLGGSAPIPVAAAAVTTDSMDMGKGGIAYNSLYLSVILATPFSAGSMSTIALQTAVDSAFTVPVTVETYSLPASLDQTKPQMLWQQKLPVSELLEFVRLVLTPTGTGAGAQIFAHVNSDVPLR